MLKRISIAVLVGFAIFLLSSFGQAQPSLTAKSGGFRTRPASAVVESDESRTDWWARYGGFAPKS